MRGDNPLFRFAHVLWQKHGLRMEEFERMPKLRRLCYIASELLAAEEYEESRER